MPTRIQLCTGILERDGRVLLVASRYANHAEPLWNLPGGRHEFGETFAAATVREFREETGLAIVLAGLAYVAESYDRATQTQVCNVAFHVRANGEPAIPPGERNVVACAWVPRAELATRLAVKVVREPLIGHLADPGRRYFGFAEAGITIDFNR
ncbi:MAG: NUDIX hydrolase [Candidatus Velthaea sp.]|jgi:ADP-ribose pyrophosphatase YjhB (NUDIX family)